MADTQVLGTCVFGRAGSSPASRTRFLSGVISASHQNQPHFTGEHRLGKDAPDRNHQSD